MLTSSPFIQLVPHCKRVMRKLRKKIYKHTTSKNYSKSSTVVTNDIFSILEERQVPSYLLDSLKKKRSYDLTAIKNVGVIGEISLQEMKSLTLDQENETECLFLMHQQRNKLKREENILRNKKKEFELGSRRTISSTEMESAEDQYLLKYSYSSEERCSMVAKQENFHDPDHYDSHHMNHDFYPLESSSILSQYALFKS